MSSTSPKAKAGKEPSIPRPSASILLISPTNQVLLLHRVRTSSSFPSAHVFPGGNLEAEQDGDIPAPGDPQRHCDGPAYRVAAIRECFEESGLLLAKKNGGHGSLLELSDEDRENGRRAIHHGKTSFRKWLDDFGALPDIDSLIPFTRWITPTNIPQRFTTQMYLYFLPLSFGSPMPGSLSTKSEAIIPTPTADGGIEHTAARFLSPSTWLSMARSGEIILFPPQFFLLYLLQRFLSADDDQDHVRTESLARQRENLLQFVRAGDPPWSEKCISPTGMMWMKGDGRGVLALDKPGPELEGSGRRGDDEHVVLVRFTKEGPRDVEVALRKDILRNEGRSTERL